MSAARDEADLGPELPTSDTGSDVSKGQDGEEQDAIDNGEHGGTETLLEDDEETVAPDIEKSNRKRQSVVGKAQPSTSPAVTGRPSSADGSLSIPDDTPSLKVR